MGEIARIDGSIGELMTIGKAMSASGYFSDVKDANQAIVKILAGREMGFGPFAALSDIHIIQGKPVVGANLMAAAVKSHPKYDYRVTVNTDMQVAIEFYQDSKSIGVSTFTMEDAKAAKLHTKDNWQKFPRNMLFARAISNGVRWYCPDVFSGAAVYTPDEIEADVVEVKRTPQPEDSITMGSVTEIPYDDVQTQALHWIDNPDTRRKFWAWSHSQGLSNVDVHAALNVEHVNEFDGDKAAAVKLIDHWIENRALLDEVGEAVTVDVDSPL